MSSCPARTRASRARSWRSCPSPARWSWRAINVVSRHTKPRKQGEQGGILKKEAPIYACKVQRVCPKCNKPTRPAHKLLEGGKKVRVCKKCGAEIVERRSEQ